MSKRDGWDERYAASELVWGTEPNRFVAEALAEVAPRGRALDLACGEGRNAIWLAERGWQVTAVDFSRVALERGRKLADRAGVPVRFVLADVSSWRPRAGGYALVLVSYLQLPPDPMRRAWRCAASALAPGAELFAIGHADRNLAEGVGGPRQPEVLWQPDAIARELRALGLRVDRAEYVEREVEGEPRPALDVRIRAHRPPDPRAGG